MTDGESIPEPYLPLRGIAVLIVATSLLTALGVLALARSPAYAASRLRDPAFLLFFGFFMSIALGAFCYQNRANP